MSQLTPPVEPPPPDTIASPYGPPAQPLRTGMAVAALVLGILGLFTCLPAGVVGLILGIIALVRANSEPQRYGGGGMAIGGIVTGALGVLLFPVMIGFMMAILLPSLSRARELAKRAVDSANLRGVGQSLAIYAHDNDGAFPPDLEALVVAGMCTPKQFINPSSGNVEPACDYYYVVWSCAEAGQGEGVQVDWITAYSDPAFHAGEGANILYYDGHVEFVKEPQFSEQVERFKQAYEAECGQPPEIIPPH